MTAPTPRRNARLLREALRAHRDAVSVAVARSAERIADTLKTADADTPAEVRTDHYLRVFRAVLSACVSEQGRE